MCRAAAQQAASNVELHALDGDASLEAAAAVLQCKACTALSALLWQSLTGWLAAHEGKVPSKKRIAAHATELCEGAVPVEVLKAWSVLRAQVTRTNALPWDAPLREFHLLMPRQKQLTTNQVWTRCAEASLSARDAMHVLPFLWVRRSLPLPSSHASH